ncbi:sensor histidine kinase [Propionibacterium australiense]|uniref:Histidine kinase n=1 Tax=Propionibacterium australiense TaxID=119981 RepID=A0A383S4L3_9ACTN|nr:histidine kinase [Propionibacterium australiense]RLP12015.1 two component system sensor kinase [Propionibacterium australiense]RLP12677.1 two component system sensor kinase [Propionibacterium australiense]SYZ32621.1 Histidine kinase [Propionibacterium australiense]VEH91628.1 Sensor histidine kinase desK [Propionibacterium australiense]
MTDRAASPAGDRAGFWHRIDWMASIWVIFLLVPLTLLVGSAASWPVKAGGVVGICGFIVVYLVMVNSSSEAFAWNRLPEGASPAEQLRVPLRASAVLLVPVALTLPGLGWWAFYFLPFFTALLLYTTRLGTGLLAVALLNAGAVICAVLFIHDAETRWSGVLGPCFSVFLVALSRIGVDAEERRQVKERELAAAAEREEISRDVHDLLGHSLTVLTLKAEVAQRLVRRDPDAAEHELGEIVGLARTALADVRATVTRLRVPDLAGQLEASRTAFAAGGLEAAFSGRAEAVPAPQRELLAWALREATTNVLRHAGARSVRVELAPGLVRVTDDGAGTTGCELGNGLRGLSERIRAAGGTLTLTSPAPESCAGPGPGTLLEVRL